MEFLPARPDDLDALVRLERQYYAETTIPLPRMRRARRSRVSSKTRRSGGSGSPGTARLRSATWSWPSDRGPGRLPCRPRLPDAGLGVTPSSRHCHPIEARALEPRGWPLPRPPVPQTGIRGPRAVPDNQVARSGGAVGRKGADDSQMTRQYHPKPMWKDPIVEEIRT